MILVILLIAGIFLFLLAMAGMVWDNTALSDYAGQMFFFGFLLVTIACGIGIYLDCKSPTFNLKKYDWDCTDSHQETQTTFIMSGSVMIPITSTNTVCDNYRRNR